MLWIRECLDEILFKLPIETHAMSLRVNVFEWSSVHMGHWNTYKMSSSHHGSNLFGRNSVHTANPIMDESFWMKLSSHWAIPSWMKVFGWNSVHTGQCHHGSKILDETPFTLGSVIMGQCVWMKLSSTLDNVIMDHKSLIGVLFTLCKEIMVTKHLDEFRVILLYLRIKCENVFVKIQQHPKFLFWILWVRGLSPAR
jgi:hypothetical protein